MYTKTFVCFANSRKKAGRCVAGREITPNGFGGWIRPVSARQSEELSEEERRYENGQDPKLLDVIDVPLSSPFPHGYQTENHVIEPDSHWVRRRTATWADVATAVETFVGPLWVNGHSSYYGLNDRVPESIALTLTRSLYLIEPTALNVIVVVEGAEFGNGRRRVRARFEHSGNQYKLSVTDPVAEATYLGRGDGEYPIGEAILCISLGELHSDHFAYKLVAALITPANGGGA